MGYANIQRCSVDVEAAFGVAQVEVWRDLPLVAGSFKPTFDEAILPNKQVTPRLHDRHYNERGNKHAKFTASFYLDALPLGILAGGAYAHPQFNLALLLRAMLGAQRGAIGSLAVAASADVTHIRITDATGVNFPKGTACLIGAPGDGRCEGRVAEIIDMDATPVGHDILILRGATLPAIPNAGDIVYNCATFTPDASGVGGNTNSLAFSFVGLDTDDSWKFMGCCGTFSIRMGMDDFLYLDIEMTAANWVQNAAEPLLGETLVGSGPITVNEIMLHYGLVGASAAVHMHAHEMSLQPNLKLLESKGGPINGLHRFFQGRMTPHAEFTFHMLEYATWDLFWDYFTPALGVQRTPIWLLAQIGNRPITVGPPDTGTGVVAIGMPNCYFSAPPDRVAGEDDFIDVKLAFDGTEDETVVRTAAPTAIEVAPFKIYVF
jgi:hypothetical protein